jgi:hypothetical protein
VTATAFLAVAAAVAGDPLRLAPHLLGGSVTCGFLLAVPASLVALAPVPPVRVTAVVAAIAVLAGGGVAPAVMAARRTVVPGLAAVVPGYSETDGGLVTPPDTTLDVPRDLYADVVALPLLEGRKATAEAFSALQAERPPNDIAAGRIRADILPQLRGMLDLARSVHVDDPAVTAVHEHALTGAELEVAGFEAVAAGLERSDPAQVRQGSAQIAQANGEWQQWAVGVGGL